MNIETLKCFLLVAESLSFSRAAEALYISQPAVTKQINSLENELGVPLFIRSTRHVELTPSGMSFYKDAKEIVNKSYLAVEHIKSKHKSAGALSIGTSNSTILNYIAPVLKRLHETHGEIHPNIEVLNHHTLLNLFTENKLDIIFFYKENFTAKTDAKFKELTKDHFCLLTAHKHPLSEKESVSIFELADENIIICNPLNAPASISKFQQKITEHHSPDKIIYCNSIEIAHCMVSAKMGVTILPKLLCPVNYNLSATELENPPKLSFGCFYHTKNQNKALNDILKII